MSSKKKRSHQSHPRTAPPTILARAPLTTSSMPPMNSTLSNVYPSHLPNTRMPSQPVPLLDHRLGPRLEPSLARPDIPTGSETSIESTYSRPVHAGPGQIVTGHPFHVTAHGFGRGILPPTGHILMPDERSVRNGFLYRQDNGKSESKAARQLVL